ncbi:MAG: ABC transporter permease [Bacteroidetes bacterium]|nr:ABC transporter permease [Bacteroidota bacterium]
MANRRLSDLGVNPAVGYILGIATFILISEVLFTKTEFAKYLVILTGLGLIIQSSEIKRTEFLKIVFGNKRSRKIRVIENLFISLPFTILLMFHMAFIESFLLILSSLVVSNLTLNNTGNYTIPTPFSKMPFEFTVGFRNTFFIFPIAFILTIIAISVNNLNIGIFSMLLVFLTSLSFYVKPENEYFVWVYSVTPAKFIYEKLKIATLYISIPVSPIAISLFLFYPENSAMILIFLSAGFAFLWTMILIKYSAYPNEMNLLEGILIALCINFPPLLLAVIPFFYFKSINKLNALLK